MILFVAGSIYLPRLFVRERPTFNFVYTQDGVLYMHCEDYFVKDGVLTVSRVSEQFYPECKGRAITRRLFVYDIAKDESKEIKLEDVQKLKLSSNYTSPDGFSIQNGMNNEGIFPLFFYSSTDYRRIYIKGHGLTKKLNIEMNSSYYDPGYFNFVGWVTPSN
jgi:hypothetical protein